MSSTCVCVPLHHCPGLKNKPDLQPSRQEAASALARFLRSRGVRVGLALCPSTPPHEAIALAKEGVLDMVRGDETTCAHTHTPVRSRTHRVHVLHLPCGA